MSSYFLRGGGQRSLGGGDAEWYRSGGAPLPVAVYKPLGAASLAASYVNLVSPGVYDAAPGTAPTFNAATGWTFNGGTQYLDTGIVPENDQTWSIIVRFSDTTLGGGAFCAIGASSGSNRSMSISVLAAEIYYWNGQFVKAVAAFPTGILAIAGNTAYRNGVPETGAIGAYSGAITHSFWIGACNVSGSYADGFPGKIQAVAIYDVPLTAEQVACITAAMQSFEYVASPSVLTALAPADLFENGYDGEGVGYYESSTNAFARFTTQARVIGIDTYSNLFALIPGACHLDVRVNGASYATPRAQVANAQRLYVPLPTGEKTVDIVSGGVSKPSTDMLGTFLVGLWADQLLTLATPTSTDRLLIYGDSIATGDSAAIYAKDGWPALLRAERGNVMVEAWGFRGLHTDANTTELRTAFVARVASYAPAEIWMAIGTNDYGLELWSAADFGTAYAALLDDLHTALPNAVIWCQTPISRTTETANALGSTMPDYRTQITTAVSTRTAYATLVDGTAWTVALADGVHPTTAGHAAYYNYVAAALGL